MDPIELQYDSMDDVPEAFRGLFEEQDGKVKLTKVKGLKTQADIDRQQTGLTKERNEHKETKTKLQAWSKLGKTPEELAEMAEQFPTLKAAAEAGGSKSAEAVQKQVDAAKGELDKKYAKLVADKDTLLNQANARLKSYEDALRTQHIRDAVMKAIEGSKIGKFNPDAIEDALMFAERHLQVEEERDEETGALTFKKVFTRDGVGVTPDLEAAAWLGEMQSRKGHWYMPSEGAGSNGGTGRNGGPTGGNPWSKDGWNITAQGQYFKAHGKEKSDQMARAAGSYLGAHEPPGGSLDAGNGQPRRIQGRR
jgi:hypothetical protein